MKQFMVSLILALFVVAMACNGGNGEEETEKEAQVINPNGTSELAQLMRDMYDAGMKSKKAIIKGNRPELEIEYEKILGATPTDSTMIDYPEFEPIARNYIVSMQWLDTVSKEDAPQAHMAMVNTCKGCHSISCPGPIARIKKLELPEVLVEKE